MVRSVSSDDLLRETPLSEPRVISQAIGGNPLTEAAIARHAPDGWYERPPLDATAWRARFDSIRGDFDPEWLQKLYPAFVPTGRAKERLDAVGGGRGLVVTTGQQPGLFGGPVYTLSKALSALALADALQDATGIPVAPVFWAATDDTDFREASSTAISLTGGAQLLRIEHQGPLGQPMSTMPLGDVSALLEALEHSVGAAVDPTIVEVVAQHYRPGQTIGSAYVFFLRALFEPLGIAVIDASHVATRRAAKPLLVKALQRASEIAAAVKARSGEIESAGFTPQVQDVPGLSLVFSATADGRKRVPIKSAAKQITSDELGPNVLLRPVVERAILPTVTYIGGPAEISYFAQLGPIADVLEVSRPTIVPRWSCMIIEPHVERILKKFQLAPEDLRDPHEAEARLARGKLSARVLDELNQTRAALDDRMSALSDAVADGDTPVPPAVTGGLRANLSRRLDRFERRLIAAAKRQHGEAMTEIATARGSLYPLGKPQERGLNFVPLLARYGPALREEMLRQAAAHAQRIVVGKTEAALEKSASAR